MILPLFGTCMVFLLVLLIMLEAKLSGLTADQGSGIVAVWSLCCC